MFLSYVAYSPILFMFTPDHWCSPDPDLVESKGLTEDQAFEVTVARTKAGERSRCFQYDIDTITRVRKTLFKVNFL